LSSISGSIQGKITQKAARPGKLGFAWSQNRLKLPDLAIHIERQAVNADGENNGGQRRISFKAAIHFTMRSVTQNDCDRNQTAPK
jgi:hypothetical protein